MDLEEIDNVTEQPDLAGLFDDNSEWEFAPTETCQAEAIRERLNGVPMKQGTYGAYWWVQPPVGESPVWG
jgi:hypothetical protein